MSSALSSLSSPFVASPPCSPALASQSFGVFISTSVQTCTSLDQNLSKIVSNYLVAPAIPVIGPEELEKIWRIKKVGIEELSAEFYNWWDSPDAYDKMLGKDNPDHIIRLNSETHYPPVFRDLYVRNIDTDALEVLSLGKVGHLAENPKTGYHPSRYDDRADVLTQKRKMAAADRGRYICMRKEGIGRGWGSSKQIELMKKLNAEFGAGYEAENSALDVAFVALAIHALTGKRPLGDSPGVEGRYTMSRCSKNTVNFMHSENDGSYSLCIGRFSPLVVKGAVLSGGLCIEICDRGGYDDLVVSCLRKFLGC